MRAAMALAAVCGSAKVLVLLWPAEPIRPQRVVRLLPSWEISQNLLEAPATNSKWRGLADEVPRGGNAVFDSGGDGSDFSAGPGMTPEIGTLGTAGGTPAELAGEDACATGLPVGAAASRRSPM